jgi:hypothetical protein
MKRIQANESGGNLARDSVFRNTFPQLASSRAIQLSITVFDSCYEKRTSGSKGPSPYFAVNLEPAFGRGAVFKCLRIEVTDALPSTENGQVLSVSSEQNR